MYKRVIKKLSQYTKIPNLEFGQLTPDVDKPKRVTLKEKVKMKENARLNKVIEQPLVESVVEEPVIEVAVIEVAVVEEPLIIDHVEPVVEPVVEVIKRKRKPQSAPKPKAKKQIKEVEPELVEEIVSKPELEPVIESVVDEPVYIEGEIEVGDMVQMKPIYSSKYYYFSDICKVTVVNRSENILTLEDNDLTSDRKYHVSQFNIIERKKK